ncbi:cytochrome P450 [Catenulispora subtropica]|uniref:Cytochrome P450 n=1 Tax=Catenulispora subtropica TaxID=450798 RepID=A0ABN2SQ51_9ACTN
MSSSGRGNLPEGGNLSDPDLFARGEAHDVWTAMRRTAPVRWQDAQAADRGGFWSVTRHADVSRVLRDHAAFTSSRGTLLNLLGRADPASDSQLAATDPPRHDRMRAPLQHAMTARSVQPHRERLRAWFDALLEPLGDGEAVDFAQLVRPVPFAAAGPMLGIPEADWDRLATLVMMASAEEDPAVALPRGPEATLRRAHRELFAYFLDLTNRRRRAPGEDLVSLLLSVEVGGVRLDPGAVVANCYSLALGAGATVPTVIVSTMAELMVDSRRAEGAKPRGPIELFVEEALRWASPAGHFMRHAVRPVDLGGVRVGAGDAVVAWLPSANRDEAVFGEPFRFVPDREPNRHVAFGAGRHYCLGAPLARMTLAVFFEALFGRFGGFEPAGQAERLRSVFLNGFRTLPVRAGTS